MRRGLALAALLWADTALARCEKLDEAGFRNLVWDSEAAIDHEDAELHAQIVAELRTRIPCLTFAPQPRLWAEFLVGDAIVEFANGGDWQHPMATALAIAPNIDRRVGSGHPLARWEPPPPPPPSDRRIPESGITVFIDGVAVEFLPNDGGLHLVQKTRGGTWSSLLVLGDVPEDWLIERVKPLSVIEWRATALGAFGVAVVGQAPNWEGATYIPDFSLDSTGGALGSGAFGAIGHGMLTYGSFGAVGSLYAVRGSGTRAIVPLDGTESTKYKWSSSGLALHGSAVWTDSRFYAGPGFGIATADVFEGETHRAAALPYVLGTVGHVTDRSQYEMNVGFGFATERFELIASGAPMPKLVERLRVGFEFTHMFGHFEGLRFPGLGEGRSPEVLTSNSRILLTLGWAWEGR